LYDGLNPVQELQAGSPSANMLTGLGIDEYFQRSDSSGASSLLTDALGSTLALADSSGAIQTSYTYEPFGNTTASGASSTNPFQFTGRENDGTGMYYYRARYYSPSLSRFVSEDPLEYGGGDADLYEYAQGDPTDHSDPRGTFVFPDPIPPIIGTLGPVISGGVGVILEILLTPSEIAPDPPIPSPPPPPAQCKSGPPTQEECDEEWNQAYQICRDLLSKPNPPGGLTGGYKNLEDCARGFVSEDCGGNPVDY
jgi:RHS repeat-associated protein